VIHIKRFRYDMWGTKISTHVEFPLEGLDMQPYCKPRNDGTKEKHTLYNLVAIVNHRGVLGGGHYVAYAKNFKNNEWFEFDDSSVSQVSEQEVLSKEAYVLLYERQIPDKNEERHKIKAILKDAGPKQRNLDAMDIDTKIYYISSLWYNKLFNSFKPWAD